jgi:hypothetical protein
MTPQEYELISQLFTRLKQTPAQPRDAEAADLIQRLASEQPDATYKLVQTVLIQDMALNQAQARLAELERQAGEPGGPPRASFLPQSPRGSVPAAGPWQRSVPQVMAPPQAGPVVSSPPPASSSWASPMPSGAGSASSGFLRAAAATALGVVGGQFLFQGIQSMFGSHAGGMLAGQPPQPSLTENVVNNFYGDAGREAAGQKAAQNDPNDTDPAGSTDSTMADGGDPDPTLDDATYADVASNDDWSDDSNLV